MFHRYSYVPDKPGHMVTLIWRCPSRWLTKPQALQWCLRLIRALKGSLHFIHIVTSLSRIHRGARFPSSAFCGQINVRSQCEAIERPYWLQGERLWRDTCRHFPDFFQCILEWLIFLLEDLDGLLESLNQNIEAHVRAHYTPLIHTG